MSETDEMSFDEASGAAAAVPGKISSLHRSDAPRDDDAASVDDESLVKIHEGQVLPVADEHCDEDQKRKEGDKVYKKEAPHSMIGSGIESLKYLYSVALLIFSITIVMAAIFSKETKATDDMNIPPGVAFVVFWFLIVWLAFMEGGQGALVGLQPIDKTLYAESHPRALINTSFAHEGDNMERFIVGRQFLVVLVVFVTNMMASAVDDASVLGLPDILNEIFLTTGIAVILTTITIGQLCAQINAANCMLDFINNYFILFTIYVSLLIEMSGLLHSVYLVQIIFYKVSGKPIDSEEEPRNAIESFFFWARVLISLVVLGFSFAVTLTALFDGKTTMYEGVPEYASVIILFILMAFIGMMEGMQIALFAVVNLPEDELKKHPFAYKVCELTFTGSNLQAFLIGRQICVTCCTFIVALITSCDVDVDAGEDTIFGVSSGIQGFFNTGLLGAVITTIVASLAWRIIASSFPIAFLSNPLIYVIIRLCLIIEASGICSAAWLIASVHKNIAGYQLDEVYVGTPEERAAADKKGELEFQEEN
jgi:hypothetical protein